MARKDLMEREQTISTAMPNGIAIPHAKTNAVQDLTVAIGIKNILSTFIFSDKAQIINLTLTQTGERPFTVVFDEFEKYGYSKCQT